ncbi:TPA: DUF3265 domain-containing protein [Vibrio parahaemolyticus]|nr:DUF3265 domain-containing protein [Vibrio parahaemolyticus]MBE4332200.1 DUF3265 domain-containing protein [Vibrio parahaemolyticus]MBE4345805.1 DUF3265 domain-containing protein [Vibrio parahaemolyticus]HCE4730131.1 DUF3265 domain-containing protein [Vibrio parahaemolyticus]HCG5495719.1 DUF3265 domain-containing protein [Vibrio parahaemolyticus]
MTVYRSLIRCQLRKICSKYAGNARITNSSRGIQHAWHFWYAAGFGVEVPCGSLVIACFTP